MSPAIPAVTEESVVLTKLVIYHSLVLEKYGSCLLHTSWTEAMTTDNPPLITSSSKQRKVERYMSMMNSMIASVAVKLGHVSKRVHNPNSDGLT